MWNMDETQVFTGADVYLKK